MAVTDSIGDMLTRIRNANLAYHDFVLVPYSTVKENIAAILKGNGYVEDVVEVIKDNKRFLKIFLKYTKGKERFILGIKRISKPGRRLQIKKDQVPRVLRGAGIAIISTPRGLMTDKEARKIGQGGEVVCYIW